MDPWVSHFDRNCILIDDLKNYLTVISSYNYPYYSNYLEECGYHKDVDYLEHRIRISEEPDNRIEKISSMSLKRKNFLGMFPKRDLIKRGKEFLSLLTKPILVCTILYLSMIKIKYLIDHFFFYINPEFVKIVVDRNNKMVAVGIAWNHFQKRCNLVR